jgi:hypothetical protein
VKFIIIARVMAAKDGVAGTHPAAAQFEADINWLPMDSGVVITDPHGVPLEIFEITISDGTTTMHQSKI